MEYTIEDINEKVLYVLKRPVNGAFTCEFIKIDDELRKEIDLDSIIEMANNQNIESIVKINLCNELLDKLFNEYKFLFYDRSYCSRNALRSFYCDFKTIYNRENIEIRVDEYITVDGRRTEVKLNHIDVCLYNFISWINQFIHSYLIEICYEKCIKYDKNTIFSHRKVGFTGYEYTLNESLSVNVSTNFSFGYASYFFITLKYKGIQIIPYSRLVHFRIIDVKQLIRHTREYECFDHYWKDALDFVRDASNDFIKNGHTSFISKYIINECEEIRKLLPKYLTTNIFNLSETLNGTFSGSEFTFNTIKLEGYDLYVFRGEKMSGALNYISSIKMLSDLIPTQQYIDCIERCAKEVLPELILSISDLEAEIEDMDCKISYLKDFIKGLDLKYSTTQTNEFYSVWERIKKFLIEKNSINNSKLSVDNESIYNELLIQYPQFKELADGYMSKIELNALQKKISYLKDCFKKINSYKNTIDMYFSSI